MFQGQWSVALYAAKLHDMAFFYIWPATSPKETFLQGPTSNIKTLMVSYECHMSLDSTIALASQLEHQVPELSPEPVSEPAPEPASKPAPEPASESGGVLW